jgi:copper(I)-binding protein
MVFATAFAGDAALAQTRTVPAPGAPTHDAKATIDARDGWTRATPGHSSSAAVYLRVVNSGKTSDTLTAVESPNAQHASLHETTMTGGVARMAMAQAIAIPPSGTVTLAPNGKHIMLEGLKAPLRQGESFIITLTFAKAGKISTTVRVLAVNATGPGT